MLFRENYHCFFFCFFLLPLCAVLYDFTAQGREDEATVLTTTSKTTVERVSSDEAVVRLLRSTSPSSASSPLRKKTRREEAAVTTADDELVLTSLIRAHSLSRDATLLSYKVSLEIQQQRKPSMLHTHCP